MAVNTNKLRVSDLDFDKIKNNLKTFLQSQAQFKDYDFEGSSLSILVDLLAYNTHYNSFYANMIANEMFLDTAIYRESIVSKAKMLGYTPTSRKASEVFVGIKTYITAVSGKTAPSSLILKQYSKFTSSVGDKTYTFITNEENLLDYTAVVTNNGIVVAWEYSKDVVRLVEGSHVHYEYESTTGSQLDIANVDTDHYVIPSDKCDTTTLKVVVQNSQTDLTENVFTLAGELQTLTADDKVYWLNEVDDFKYEIKFGDGVTVGYGVELGNIIKIDYVATNGVDANGCTVYSRASNPFPAQWDTDMPIVEYSTYPMTVTPVKWRVLELDQDYDANFIVGETVFGYNTKAEGIVNEWDGISKKLKLISVTGVFSINETVIGYESNAQGKVTMSSLERSKSANGKDRESDESIKSLAPVSYKAQSRCVTVDDYEAILKKEYPNIRAIKVWGGDTMTPPVYGKVYICLRPHESQFLTVATKEYIRNSILSKKNIVTVQTEIVDPDYIYIIPTCAVKYNPTLTVDDDATIIQNTRAEISNFAKAYLNDFAAPFYYTKLTSNINDVSTAIVSNVLSIKIKKYFEPTLNVLTTGATLNFSNAIKKNVALETTSSNTYEIITTSTFTFKGISNCEFSVNPTDISKLQIIKRNDIGAKEIVVGGEYVGSVDYDKGIITIFNFTTTSTTLSSDDYPEFKGRISFTVTPVENDLFSHEHQIIDILNTDITVTTTDVRTLL